jgi:RimJ/RimL family protein N-acetyltransferase
MEIGFRPVELSEIDADVRAHLAAQTGRIDSFLEGKMRESRHYRIALGGADAGFASIHGGSLITQFALAPPFRAQGQQVFRELRRMERVGSAFVPTCDEFYLVHALDDYRQLAKQAYFFVERPDLAPLPDPARVRQTAATAADAGMIRAESGDFCDPIAERIGRRELYLTRRDGETAGIGIIERSAYYNDVASVGMFTLEPFRGSGIGTATIRLMIEVAHAEGRRAVAGCWYYNHGSKRTLERAGLSSPTRLLKIDY